MPREWLACAVIAHLAGCSWVLDFSEGQIPVDVAIDQIYTQAECDYMEPNDTAATAAVFTPSDVGPAAICPGVVEDRDFYRFTLPALASVTVKITFVPIAGGDLDLRLSDVTGEVVYGSSRGFTGEESITCPSPFCTLPNDVDTDFVFEVFGASGAANRYDISLAITPP